MKARAVVRLRFPSEKSLEMVFRALEPEAKTPATVRSSVNLEKDGAFLVLKVDARDTVALRAALNAYLRWINSILDTVEVLKRAS